MTDAPQHAKTHPASYGVNADAIAVDWNGPNDASRPRNWSPARKWAIVTLNYLATFMVSFSSSVFSGFLLPVEREFGISADVSLLGISLYVLGFAFGPMVWGPVSELYGKRRPLWAGYLFFCIFQAVSAVARSPAALFVSRFLQALLGSSTLAIMSGMFVDFLTDPTSRGIATAVFSLAVFCGPAAGPIVGNAVTAHLGWRWAAWITLMFSAVIGLCAFSVTPETSEATILRRRAQKLREKSKTSVFCAAGEANGYSLSAFAEKYLTKPLRMFALEPIKLVIMTVYMSFVYGIIYLTFTLYPQAFVVVRGWSPVDASMSFFGVLAGVVIACVFLGAHSIYHVGPRFAETKQHVPERRLPPMIESGAIPTSVSPSSAQSASSSPAITSAATAVPGNSGVGAPSTTPGSSTTEEPPDYTVLPWFATITPPPGVEPTTSVTWSSSDYKTSTRRDDGVIVPIIVPVWVCGVAQILCHPKCIIPFISCDISGPGPLGFPWAKPPPSPPKPKPKPGNPDDPSDPDDPEPSQTQTTSSETSCTATSTISPYCDQRCDVRPYTTEGSTHAWSTVCHTATCQPTVVQCSQTVDKTTTTTYSTVSAEPTEVFCGDPGGFCMDCAKKPPKPKLKPRQVDDLDVLSGPEGLTHPGTWPLGPDDWFRRMYYDVGDYCEGLGAPRTLSDGQTVEMGYSTMNADDFGDEPIMGGTGPLWGCRALLIITRHGIYTSHNWEVPNFSKGSTNLPIDPDEEFKQGIEEFLKSGDRTHHPYVGVDYLKQNYRIFNSKPVKVFIINPSTLRGAWWEVGPPSKAESDLKKPDSVRRWKRYMKNTLGWSEGKGKGKTDYETLAYNQGPGQWPAWRDNPDLPRNRPMDYYEPPWGMVHWQYHPQHTETVKGKKVKRAALRVWYESHLIWETSWKLEAAPPGSPSASAPIWKASGSAVPSAGQPQTRTNSAGVPIILPTSPTNQTLNTTAIPIGQSGQPSKSKGSVVIVTATAETTITKTRMWLPGSTVRVPDPKPIGPVKRAVRITEQVTMNESKHSHKATVDIYEVDAAGKENLLTSVKDSGGGEVQLPSVMNIADLKGGTLKVDFVASQFDINFEWSLGDLTLQWSNSASKNEEGGPWCENPDADKVSDSFKRVVNCFWEA
ncbi:Citrinin biosynthesis cluster MFS transporter mrr1 [Colletotrichum sidae]|uniref:Citrinin biosynthesis cluster MFS transporter mrr1 n=1 Tax=Colletotrichum sidae TaxID=1347389 RepID=A0A4R8TCK9_9PEZI|nr:Citrinin biosynthesis cluster MFS transporter mrr1 [Colletotrichum sidae]